MDNRMQDNDIYFPNYPKPVFEEMGRATRRMREEPMPSHIPDWLRPAPEPKLIPSKEAQALTIAHFEMVFPRVLEYLYKGFTLANALREFPLDLDPGAFFKWLKQDPKRVELYKEAKEIRTEAWAGKIIQHAEGTDENGDATMNDVARSKLIVDTYWKLMQADNRKTYGDTKQIEVNQSISITAALEQANARVSQIIDAEFEEVTPRLLESGDEDDD